MLGAAYRGDLDAPRVVSISEPELGWSMELDQHGDRVRDVLRSTAAQLAPQVDVYGIACNTLNVFCDDLAASRDLAGVVSIQGSVARALRAGDIGRVGLLGSRPVAELGRWSAYRDLVDEFEVVTPDDPATVQELFYDVKLHGGASASLNERLGDVILELATPVVLLACTELPLLRAPVEGVTTLDATSVLAERLVAEAFAPPS